MHPINMCTNEQTNGRKKQMRKKQMRQKKTFAKSQAFNNNTQRPARNPEIQAQNPNTPNSVAPGVSNRFGPADDDDDSPIKSVADFVYFFFSFFICLFLRSSILVAIVWT